MDRPLDSMRYLLGRAMLVEERIRTLVAHRRGHDPAPDDPFRGLYLSDELVDKLLANVGLRKRYYRASGADAYTMLRPPQGNPT